MPFLRGSAPIRKTLAYLQKGSLVFKDNVRIVTFHFNKEQAASQGAEDFVFWHGAQLLYKNPHVHMCFLSEMTPSPFVQVYFDTGKRLTLDIDGLDKNTINDTVKRIFCKTKETLEGEQLAKESKSNPANFGPGCSHECICEIPGQVPCPGWVILPHELRGKYKYRHD